MSAVKQMIERICEYAEFGMDLEMIAEITGFSVEEVSEVVSEYSEYNESAVG